MPTTPSPAQSDTSRQNGARPPAPRPKPARLAPPSTARHGLCGRTFFLLPDEDPAEFLRHEALWLAAWRRATCTSTQAAEAAIRCMWREERADRLEAVVLTDLFAAGKLADPAEARPPRRRPSRREHAAALRGRIEREHRAAMQALESLRQCRLARPVAQPSEPEPALQVAAAPAAPRRRGPRGLASRSDRFAAERTRTAPALNRHQRRALAAMDPASPPDGGRGAARHDRPSRGVSEPVHHSSNCYGRGLDNGQTLGRIA